MTTGIQAILFDFGGTLDNDGMDWFERLYRSMMTNGNGAELTTPFSAPVASATAVAPISRETFLEHIKWVAKHVEQFPDTASLPMEGMILRLCEHLHRRLQEHYPDQQQESNPHEIAALFMLEASQVLMRNRSVLQQLKKQYRLGVISNNWGNAAGWCQQFQLDRWIEVVIDSTQHGAAKPDTSIFHAATDLLGVPPEACAYVGDHYECDIVGAHHAGMLPIWIVGDQEKPCPDESIVGHRLKSLPQLAEMTL